MIKVSKNLNRTEGKMSDRPISRKKNITGSGSTFKRGSGLGTGKVGNGNSRVPNSSNGSDNERSSGGGFSKLIIALLCLLLGGGGGIGALLGGNSGQNTPTNTPSSTISTIGSMASLLLGSGFSSISDSQNASWSSQSNTKVLNTSIAPGSRAKYTTIKGNGDDTVTIMVYMCGTDLESRASMASKDIQEMLNAKISDKISLLIYTGGCKEWKNTVVSNKTNQIYQVKNGKLSLLKDNIGNLPMTDPQTLSSFIKYCGQNFKADRYDLILWDHGGGSVSGYGYDEKHKESGSMGLAGINKALTEGGLKYDFIGFDACLMATVENALMLNSHSDYLIASEETEPGIGWYYTNWLNKLSQNTSTSTLEIGKTIIDDFVSECNQKCHGQKTTLSLIDLAQLSTTVPEDLKNFSTSTSSLIEKNDYKSVSNARAGTREFASSKIDQIDLIDFAIKMNNEEGKKLANSLKDSIKYNNTAPSMTNSYGLSIYFPYRQTGKVDNIVDTYDKIGMDESYSKCIQKFASLETYGQAAANGNNTPLGMLLGNSGSSTNMDPQAVAQILNSFLKGSSSMKYMSNGVDLQTAAEYISKNRFDGNDFTWKVNEEGRNVIALSESQWSNIQSIELSTFVDDGQGYIDLGLDNTFDWDKNGNLLAPTDNSALSIDGQIVSYYHIDTTGSKDDYTITGRVPVMLNNKRCDLILIFDSAHEDGYIAGAVFNYKDNETDTIAKNLYTLEKGDKIDFLCDYYSYDGSYNDSYYLGNQMTVKENMSDMKISNLIIEDKKVISSFMLKDIYGNKYYTPKAE